MDFIVLSRRQALILLGIAATVGVTGCTVRDALRPEDLAGATDSTKDALPMVNELRRSRGLSSLAYDPAAAAAAAEQARRMAGAGKMSHLIGAGDNFGNRMKRSRVQLPAAENIATGQESVTRAVQAWIDSKNHLDNMLGGYKGLGVAAAMSPSSGNRPYWAMVLSS